MSLGWRETLWVMPADGPALSNSTTAASLIGATTNAKYTLAPNLLQFLGRRLQVKASGRISTVVTTPGNLTLDLRFGSVIIATSQAMALNVTAQTNATWDLEWDLTLRAVGAGTSANFMHTAKWISRASLNAPAVGTTTGVGVVLIPDTAPAVGTGFDSSASQVFDIFATFSVANASNSITLHQASLDLLN